MRKYVILTLMLFILSGGVLIFAHSSINSQKDDITVTETVLIGDRTKAEGIELAVEVQSGHHNMYWTTISKILETGLETQSQFSRQKGEQTLYMTNEGYMYKQDDSIKLDHDMAYGGSGVDEGGSINLKSTAQDYRIPYAMALDAANATPSGKAKTSILYLKDYNENFPLIFCYNRSHRIFSSDASLIDYSYFKMPAPDNMFYAVEIEKGTKGELRYFGSAPVDDDNNYTVDSDGVIVGNILYLAISSVSSGSHYPEKIVADISPEQRGIHAIPLKENGEMRNIDLDHAKTVFHLDDHERVIRMVYREEENAFHLYTEDDGKLWFSVVDKDTMTRKQKLYIMDKAHPLLRTYWGKDYSVILDGKGNFVLTAKEENLISGNIMTLALMEHYVDSMRMETLAWDFDGTRLVVAAVQLQSDEVRDSGCLLQVFEEDGLHYAGLYENSLESDQLDRGMYTDHLLRPVEVRFVQ